jgi:hypothetical protein
MIKRNRMPIMFLSFILLSLLLSSGGLPDAAWADGDTEKSTATEIIALQSVKELKSASEEYDVVYLILPAKQNASDAIRATVLSAAEGAEQKARIGLFEMSRQTDGFKKFARQHKVKKFPAVIAMSSKGKVKTVQGVISQEKLMKAYSKVSGEKKKLRCPMSEGKPCDPKACGKDKSK